MSVYSQKFLKERFILEDIELNEFTSKAIDLLESTDELVRRSESENMGALKTEAHWPIMHDMYERSYEYVCGSLSLLVIGQTQSCEASCRTAIEGAVNLHFISLDDSIGKIVSYFKNHFEVEKRQNVNWKSAVDSSTVDEHVKDHHRNIISTKYEALSIYEGVLKKSMLEAGVDIDLYEPKWPSIYDRFRLTNDEIGYRTIYVALCSQSHNDPEDLLNYVVCRAVGNKRFTAAKKEEQYFFSLDMVLQAIKYHIMASTKYLGSLNISSEELSLKYRKILELIGLAQQYKNILLDKLSN